MAQRAPHILLKETRIIFLIYELFGDYIEKYPAARSAGASGDSPHLYRIQHPPGRLVEGHIGIPCSVRERLGRSRNVSQGLG